MTAVDSRRPQRGAPNLRQLEAGAADLAQRHLRQPVTSGTPKKLAAELDRAGVALIGTYEILAQGAAEGAVMSVGANWLLDNFYILRDQRSEVLRHLRGSFFRQLPYLPEGPDAGYPRVFALMRRLVDMLDGAVTAQALVAFVKAYQVVVPLRLGELWAIPDLLRIVLLFRLERLAASLRATYLDRRRAVDWAARLGEAAFADPDEALWTVRSEFMEVADPPSDTYVLALIDAFAAFGANARPAVEWLERRLPSPARAAHDLTRHETQRQVTIGNTVTSLRWTAGVRWGPLIESISLIERVLTTDPARLYRMMDFETRDRYRRVVERLARYSSTDEVAVARAAVEAAAGAPPEGSVAGSPRHVGYHLVGPGAARFRTGLGYRPPFDPVRMARRHPTITYLGLVGLFTGLALAGAFRIAANRDVHPVLMVIGFLAAFLPLLDLAVAFTNRLIAWIIPPRQLPKMDAEYGLGETDRALVVMPTLVRSVADARLLTEQLEIHARANPERRLRFALLTDFADADAAELPGDADTLAALRQAIRRLNEAERDEWGDRFFLLHRERRWSDTERTWMGWERKRGKLEELNRLLRRPDLPTSFTEPEGDFAAMAAGARIRYVITLDADTQLPPGAAVDLIRTAAHPLNRPYYDPACGRVTHGYGILQPRVSITPGGSNRTLFARIFSGHTGIDPYTTAVSDVYQDLFDEGIFTGKGLYDVDAFGTALADVVPAGTVLSHDLHESIFARAALVTDVEVFDDYPSGYLAWVRRLHRWVRGDWQIARWLLPRFRDADGVLRRNPITALGRWQIIDNMRRSLTPSAMLVFLLVGWVAMPRSPVLWTAVALAVLAFPVYVNLTSAVFSRPRNATWGSYVAGVRTDLRRNVVQTGLTIIFLPTTALVTLDAVARAAWRMLVTRRGLLEWTPAGDTERAARTSLPGHVREMAGSIIWSAAALLLVTTLEPNAWIAAGPFVVAWILAPWIAWRLGRPLRARPDPLSADERLRLRLRGRRTWSYFERFVGPETRWLPPDNVQEAPFRGVAARTSPTNIGLGLLSTQAAYDFGWIGQADLLDRLEHMMTSIEGLERHGGQLFNWYDTHEGRTLWPRYLSTVDTGNFAACLVALGQALEEAGSAPWPAPQIADGVRDTLDLCAEHLAEGSGDRPWTATTAALEACRTAAEDISSATTTGWGRSLERLRPLVAELVGAVRREAPPATLPAVELDSPLPVVVEGLQRLLLAEARDLATFALGAGPDELDLAQSLSTLESLRAALAARTASHPEAAAASKAISARLRRAAKLAAWCRRWFLDTDFAPLYDSRRDLFAIGLNLETLEQDAGHYDLLASEARLASFLAIAKGDVPVRHWFRLGRATARVAEGSVLLSWGGTLFEYLMPLLLTRNWPDTLLDETCRNVVDAQRHYGSRVGHPWGVSESAYNSLNLSLDYQYRAFGVPGLGLKRGLSLEYVAAPYATALALLVAPRSALRNLDRLQEAGALGPYGFYESIDYTPDRVPPRRTHVVVAAWMAHHQGMILLAIANLLQGRRMQRRFHRAPMVRAAELLLQERVPRRIEITDPHPLETSVDPGERLTEPPVVVYADRERLLDPTPRGHLLANGRYSALRTQAGTGGSWFEDWELTRWTPDPTTDPHGFFIYVRDLDSGDLWSVAPAPTYAAADRIDTWFHLNKVENALVHDWVETFVETCVSPEDNVEVHRVTITNYGDRPRRLDLTSYAEVVLNRRGREAAHPAFSKLFVETEAVAAQHALLATRRRRSEDEPTLWMFHTMAEGVGLGVGPAQLAFETDRARFRGRNRSAARPVALEKGASLSATDGPVLDPILALQCPVTLRPREKRVVSFVLGVATTRDEAIRLADRYGHPSATERALDLAGAYGPVEIQHLQLTGTGALRLQELGTAILYQDPRLRAPGTVIVRNERGQSALWPYGLSGDIPIVLVGVRSTDQMADVREAVRAFEYWHLKGMDIDLVFLNEHPASYVEELHDQITHAIHTSISRAVRPARGSMRVLRADQMPPADRVLLEAQAHAVLSGPLPTLRPPRRDGAPVSLLPPLRVLPPATAAKPPRPGPAMEPLECDNGFGGYDPAGRYVIRLPAAPGGPAPTPLPWINVVANEQAGFIASETGGGFTWTLNSRENRLTPWCNDPVEDAPGEAVYLRDEESGAWGSVTALPAPFGGGYETTHGFGSTVYRHESMGLASELTMFVPLDDPLKVVRLRIRNRTDRPRRLAIYRFQEWVLGVLRADAARMVVTERDPATGAVLARNRYHPEFPERVAFAGPVGVPVGDWDLTADRAGFIGRMRTLARPAAVERGGPLDGRLGAGLDPCAALRVPITLAPGEEQTISFLMGQAESAEAAGRLLASYGTPAAVDDALALVESTWRERLGRVAVRTPSPAINRLLDGWLVYQAWACRLWGRSAFYQSGGAYGFRDQLQDVMALVYLEPALTRRQILRHAAHQFVEGDVLHWWHPPTGRGIRTRFSDDLLWLPYVTAFYVRATGDRAVLAETAPFVTGDPLAAGEDERYFEPRRAEEDAPLYDHCCRAIDRSLEAGEHGLPLMGSGDWNDGMNRVGREGRGESVWLGFFLHKVLEDFLPFAEARGDGERVERYRAAAARLAAALEDAGWDGEWYRRAYFDDGTPLGTAANPECRIDAIAQAWAVLSGVASPERARTALESCERHLVDRPGGLVRLLTPPFDSWEKDPGYIKGYLPGVRENGGQYTHGVLWLVAAWADLGEIDRALDLLTLLAPSSRSADREAALRYQVEPYVATADVYSTEPHVGRGGWSWYTGAAAWMWRVALESVVGFGLEDGDLVVRASLPALWPFSEIDYRPDPDTLYRIRLERVDAAGTGAEVDGRAVEIVEGVVRVRVARDGASHQVVIRIAGP